MRAETVKGGGSISLALLANAIAGAILYVLITIFNEISGAHFNPVVSLIMFAMKKLSFSEHMLFK